MSHHINFDFSLNDQKKEPPKVQKSKEKNSAKKRETKKLQIDNQVMEWRLNQLKATMEKEKEERAKQGYIWKSANDEALNSYSRNILGRSVKQSSKTNQKSTPSKVKVTVLTDEPLEMPKRKSHSQDLINKLKKPIPPKRNSPTRVNDNFETVSKESWISISMDKFSEEVIEIQSDINGNLPLSSLHGINPAAIGLYFMRYGRKRLLMAVDSKIMKPKTGWGAEIYYPYVANVPPNKVAMDPAPPISSRKIKNNISKENSKASTVVHGHLLNGSFNEEENAKSFQKALMEWRNGIGEKSESNIVKYPVETSVHSVQSDPVTVDIKFSETSTLTFMEKLLIKKHRETELPPIPNGFDYDTQDFFSSDEAYFTVEELEERERFRELFSSCSAPGLHKSPSMTEFSEQTCDISEVDETDVQINNWMENDNVCIVEEVSDDDSMTDSATENIIQSDKNGMSATFPVVETQSAENSIQQESEVGNNQLFFVQKSQQVAQLEDSISHKYIQNDNDNMHIVPFKNEEDKSHPKHNNFDADLNTLVSAVSRLPLNPDAVYQRGLTEVTSEMLSQRNELQKNLDQSSTNIMLCNSHEQAMWPVDQISPVRVDSTNPVNESFCLEFTDEAVQQKIEDEETLNKLEWELASKTGNVTSDGRISRLIDEWSNEDDSDLGIINDPGCGSGLSTLELDATNVVGTAMSLYSEEQIQKDFQQMETMMMGDYNTESDRDDSDYSL